jgi:DNA adenine methylase
VKIKCVSPWAGSKRTLAPKIIELLGKHDRYCEVFVGGCSILPAKPRVETEIVNDANCKIVNVLRCLQSESDTIIRALAPVEFDLGHFEYARGYLAAKNAVANPGATTAAMQLVEWWMGPNGLAGTTTNAWFAQRHSKTGGSPESRWKSFKESLPELAARLAGVMVHWNPYQAFLQRIADVAGTVMYVDPPYFAKSFRYEFDFSAEDHRLLAKLLNSYRQTRIVISYYDDVATDTLCDGSLLDELYPPAKWRRIEVEMSKASASSSGKAKRATEVLLVNDAGIAA